MRLMTTAELGLLLVAALHGSALAQEPRKTVPSVACPEAIAAIAECFSDRLATGAYVLAAMPKRWNGNLIVFAHGGPALVPPTAAYSLSDLAKYSVEVKQGYAWVASSYRREGYGVKMAAADTDQARQLFIERIGKPQRTILHGASYGGLVAARLIESFAKNPDGSAKYDGVLLNSGLVAGVPLAYEFRVDLRVVYQYYCKNLPRPDEPQYPLWTGVGTASNVTLKDLERIVDQCTGVATAPEARSETQRQNLANILGVMGFPERVLYRHMQSATLLFRNIVLETTGGGNPFSNVGIRYTGSTDDAALNRDVVRFAADPQAAAALRADGEPTGALPVPAVSIHSINDPQVVVEQESMYRDAVRAVGNGARLVQAFTDEPEHAAQSAPELAAALDAVQHWIDKGEKPTPQTIAAACERLRATYDGPCDFHPQFQPKPYATRFYPRERVVQ